MRSAEGIAAAAFLLLFALIAILARGEVTEFDRQIMLSMRGTNGAGGPAWFVEAVRSITALGSHAVLTIIVVAVASYLLLLKDKVTAAFVVLASITGTAANTLLKVLFDRARPDIVSHLTEVVSASFPSGHAAVSAVIYLTLGALLAATHRAFLFRAYFIGVAAFLVILVGLSRIYLGVHYPTDVLAGWCFGTAWALICWMILKTLQKERVASPPENP